jgi:hypothetical protein
MHDLPKRLSKRFQQDVTTAIQNDPTGWRLHSASAAVFEAFGPNGVPCEGMPAGLEESDVYNQVIRGINTAIGNRVFVTEKGHLGVGLNAIEVGDSVALLAGGAMPYILRRIGDGSEPAYNLIGWAYITDYMHGEALQEPGFEFTNVVIR